MKKIFAVILAFAMIFSFAACGEEKKEEPQKKAAEWPKEIQVYVPAEAGSPVDTSARMLMDFLSQETGATFAPVNDATGNGLHALEVVRNANNDGSTLMFLGVATEILYANHTYEKDLFDTANFTVCGPMIGQVNTGSVWLTQADSPFNTLQELVDYIKAHPGEIVMGTSAGNLQEVKIKMFCNYFGISDTDVRFAQASNNELVVGLLADSIDVGLLAEGTSGQHIVEGKLKGLANNSLVRDYYTNPEEVCKALDAVPNYKDLGLEEIAMDAPMFVLAPAGMDSELQQLICDTINKFGDSKEWCDKAIALGKNTQFVKWELQDLIKELNRCGDFMYDVYNK